MYYINSTHPFYDGFLIDTFRITFYFISFIFSYIYYHVTCF